MSPQAVLRPHPDGPPAPLESIAVEVTREGERLRLRYIATGDIARLNVPTPTAPGRVDGLWKHTCFEAFLRGPGDAYWEVNLAPSSQWAAYGFSGYRERIGDPNLATPRIQVEATAQTLLLSADVEVFPVADPSAPWTLGLSAVIEDNSGERSYWALAHPPGKPDFHHASAFTLQLPSPDRP